MGKSKQTKEKKFNRDVEISAPYLDPEIIKAIHSPAGRLDVKHAGFKALLSDLHSQDSTDEVQPLNEKHVPSYIGISCAVSGYTYHNVKRSNQGSTLGTSITPNISRANSPILFKSDPPIHHITIDKNNIQSPDDERRELTEKLTASANETLRSCSPGIPPTEDDRHHGAYVGARYCPLPSPSQVPNKHIPLLGIDDERAGEGEATAEDKNKVQQSIASLYGDEFKENWLETMSHKTKKGQTQPTPEDSEKSSKVEDKLKLASNKSDKKQTKEDGKPKAAPSDLTGKAKNFLSKMFRHSPTPQEPGEDTTTTTFSTADDVNKVPASEPVEELDESIKPQESQQLNSEDSQSSTEIPKSDGPIVGNADTLLELETSQTNVFEPDEVAKADNEAEPDATDQPTDAAPDAGDVQHELNLDAELGQDLAKPELVAESSADNNEPNKQDSIEIQAADTDALEQQQPTSDSNVILDVTAENSEEPPSHEDPLEIVQPETNNIADSSEQPIMPQVADLVSFSPEPHINEQEELVERSLVHEPGKSELVGGQADAIDAETSNVVAPESSPDHNGNHYLNLLEIEKTFLSAKIEDAEKTLAEREPELDEETIGRLRSAIGKANLLITKKCKQFEGLCEANINQDSIGPFETHNDDLAGFWDMLSIQISDVRKSFDTIWQPIEDEKQANIDDKDGKLVKEAKPQAGKPKLSAQKDQERREKLMEHINQMKQSKTAASDGLMGCADSLITSADETSPEDVEVVPEPAQ